MTFVDADALLVGFVPFHHLSGFVFGSGDALFQEGRLLLCQEK